MDTCANHKWPYVGVEVSALVCLILLCTLPPTGFLLVWSHVAFGVIRTCARPIAAAVPPLVTTDVLVCNCWELTLGNVARCVAPLVCAVFLSSTFGNFSKAMRFGLLLQVLVIVAKCQMPFQVKTQQVKTRNKPRYFMGIMLFASHRTVLALSVNTMITCFFVYPLNTIVLPLVFKNIPRSETVELIVDAFGMRRDKAWMNFSALVSLGGVIGPMGSTVLVHRWAHVNQVTCAKYAMAMQIVAGMCMTVGLYGRDPLLTVLFLFLMWSAVLCSNNLFTIYLSSMTQTHFNATERGRVLANMFTLFSISSMGGNAVSGHAVDIGLPVAIALFSVGIVARCILLATLQYAHPLKSKIS